jgi:hypothetical protein
MRLLRLVGLISFAIGLVLELILFYEEFSNNFNYYYNHNVSFELLILVGALSMGIGSGLMLWERRTKETEPSLDQHRDMNNESKKIRVK